MVSMIKIQQAFGWILSLTYFLSSGLDLAQAQSLKASHSDVKSQKKSVNLRVLPSVLQEVEEKYSKATTLTADFTQVVQDTVLQEQKVSSGKIFVKRPSKIRWDTQKPNPNLLVSDGAHFWLYTPPFDSSERGQVIVRKSSAVQSQLANALLSGSLSIAQDMKITEKGPFEFILTPKLGSAGTVIQATVKLDPKTLLIMGVGLDHKGGNHSEISLSQIRLGQSLEDSLFKFQAPPNTDQVVE